MDRRTFFGGLGAAAAGAYFARAGRAARAAGANERGHRNHGLLARLSVGKSFVDRARVACVCDPDEDRRNRAGNRPAPGRPWRISARSWTIPP